MIVFLDFDGVLNAEKDLVGECICACVLSRNKIAILNRIPAVLPDVRFVLSTSWRNQAFYGIDGPDPRDHLRNHGFKGEFHQDWRTPWRGNESMHWARANGWSQNGRRLLRGDEIQAWIINNCFTENYAILDDCADFHDGQPLVRTDAWEGLVAEDVDRVIDLLNTP